MVSAALLLLKNFVLPKMSYSTSSVRLNCTSLPANTLIYRIEPSCLHPSLVFESLTSSSGKFESTTSADDMLAIQATGTFQALEAALHATESIDSKYRVESESEWLKLLHLSTDQ